MTKLEQIERAVAALSAEELRRFNQWFKRFQSRQFDEQIERDISSGRLDKIGRRALSDHKAGRTKPL